MGRDREMELTRLHDLEGFQVAQDDPDIRGWEVRTPDDRKVGKVEELIVDPAEKRVRYMEVKVDRKALDIDDDRHILIPIGTARLNEKKHDVLIERLPAQGLAGVPEYKRGPISREYESSLRDYYGASAVNVPENYYKDEIYDDTRLWSRGENVADSNESIPAPKIGDNEVTLPLASDQEIVVRRAGANEEIVIRKNRIDDTTRD